jgi:hypothetical protein
MVLKNKLILIVVSTLASFAALHPAVVAFSEEKRLRP